MAFGQIKKVVCKKGKRGFRDWIVFGSGLSWAVSSSALGVVSFCLVPSVRTEDLSGVVGVAVGHFSFIFISNLDNKVVCMLNLQSTGNWTDVKDKIALEFKIVLAACRNKCNGEEMVGKDKILFRKVLNLDSVKQLPKFRVTLKLVS